MKVNRTYSIDVDLVQALRSKRNQSATVCRALRLYLAGKDQYDLNEEESRRMLMYLRHRDDISEQLKAVIVAELAKGSE
jgi:Na+/phosphate symporter